MLPRLWLANLDLSCWGFCAALTGHHTSDDANLFPLVVRHFPDLRPIADKLFQDHLMLTQLVDDLDRALTAGTNDDELIWHLDGIEAVMETHFRFEERQWSGFWTISRSLTAGRDSASLFGPVG